MNLHSLSGPIRLGAAASVVWVIWSVAAALYGPIEPRLHAWINVRFVDPDEPPAVFARLDCWRLAAAVFIPTVCAWTIGALGFWVRAGYAMQYPMPLLQSGRLADVLALIQVLALDQNAHRSREGLNRELQGAPRSASDWGVVAESHPEFFRFDPRAQHAVSLVARHVSGASGAARAPLSNDYTNSLLSLAVELHDRQLKRARAWEVLVPVAVAVLGGLVAQAATR